MNLNQVRILEACHKYLNGLTSFENELAGDNLIFEYNGHVLQFESSQQQSRFDTFVDYELKYYRLESVRKFIDNIEDLLDAFNNNDALESLQRVNDINHARTQIFKLLTRVNIEQLESKYPNIKTDNFAYNVHDMTIGKSFAIYQFSESATFTLVSLN